MDEQLPLGPQGNAGEAPISRGTLPQGPTPMMPPKMPRHKKDREIPFGMAVLGVLLLAVLGFCGFVLVKMGSPAVQSDVTVEL